MRDEVIKQIEKNKLIVIVRGVERSDLIPLAEALFEGGVRLLELTYCADGSVSDVEMADRIGMLAKAFQGRLLVGAGTVLTERQVQLTANAGGAFIISPDAYEPVIRETRALRLVSIPGVMTPSEIRGAQRAGADFVKLFPAGALGAKYVKDVLAPLSDAKLLAVGGIHDGNMREYTQAGVRGFGVGSAVIDKRMIACGDFAGIKELARSYVGAALAK